MNIELNGAQRTRLRGMAMNLKPAVVLGRQGLTPSAVREVQLALGRTELVKVRFDAEGRESRQTLVNELAQRTESAVCGIVGNTASLYRPHPETSKRMRI